MKLVGSLLANGFSENSVRLNSMIGSMEIKIDNEGESQIRERDFHLKAWI